MRRIRLAAMATGLALAVAACASATPESEAPATLAASDAPSQAAASPSPSTPAPSALPTLSATASPAQGAADVVLDSALASQAEGTVRYTVDVRSADPDDPNPPQTATGQVSFGDAAQFRF